MEIMHIEPVERDLPPFSWLQNDVRVVTRDENIDGTLMGVLSSGRVVPIAFLVHDRHIDVPIWIPAAAVSSIHPLTEHILKLDEEAAKFEDRGMTVMSFSEPVDDGLDYEDEEAEEIGDDYDDEEPVPEWAPEWDDTKS